MLQEMSSSMKEGAGVLELPWELRPLDCQFEEGALVVERSEQRGSECVGRRQLFWAGVILS